MPIGTRAERGKRVVPEERATTGAGDADGVAAQEVLSPIWMRAFGSKASSGMSRYRRQSRSLRAMLRRLP